MPLEAIFEVVGLITAGNMASINIFITNEVHFLRHMRLSCLDLQLLIESDAFRDRRGSRRCVCHLIL